MSRSNKEENKAADLRRFKLGGYGVLVCVIAIAIVVIVCLIVDALPSNVTKIDLSENDIYEVSEDTHKFLSEIDQSVDPDMKVKLFLVARKSQRDAAIDLFLRKYAKMSSVLSVDYIDPEAKPDFVKEYSKNELSENSIVAVSQIDGKALRGYAIDNYSLYEYAIYYNGELYSTMDFEEFSEFYNYYGALFDNGQLTYKYSAFNAETMLATAIDYVTADHLPTLYSLVGHGETPFTKLNYVPAFLAEDNVANKALDLSADTNIPSDCDVIIVNKPGSDITENEKTVLEAYLSSGGKLIVISGEGSSKYTRLMSVCASYGLEAIDAVVSDNESGYHFINDSSILTPKPGTHKICAAFAGYTVNAHNATAIKVNETEGITHTKLLTTSAKATYKLGEEEIEGSVPLAVIAEKKTDNGSSSVMLISCSDFASDEYLNYGNIFFFVGSAEYLTDKEVSVTMTAKSLAQDMINIENPTIIAVIGIVICVVIPLAFIIAGIVISVKRRKR